MQVQLAILFLERAVVLDCMEQFFKLCASFTLLCRKLARINRQVALGSGMHQLMQEVLFGQRLGVQHHRVCLEAVKTRDALTL